MTEIVIKTKIGRQISKITTTQLICDKAPSDLGFCVIIENDNGCVIIMNFLLCIWKGDGFFCLFARRTHELNDRINVLGILTDFPNHTLKIDEK